MGPPKPALAISQQAFDEMMKENVDDLVMDPTGALQGVDLSGSGNAAIATRNGGVELVCSVCSDCLKLSGGTDQGLVSALKAMASLLHDPPDNAARAIESGTDDLAIQAMQRTLLLNNGIEKIIGKAKENHESCKNAPRDLGLDNNNVWFTLQLPVAPLLNFVLVCPSSIGRAWRI
ncbi:hypothetical protein Acr_07g0001770 [Actinidia rufa]|uniref:Uncharacterized protein n=1 Tax=Actinidia rufa TaxID=165716 RepID=A0A7J0EUE7_9ERIC|nr:hypothetical protein Acr_07g0001770 [Actinidia rufa]